MPLYTELEKIINSGDLGEFRLAQVNFGSFKEYDMTNRFFNMDLAGGALLDIGVYALSLVRMFMETENAEIHSQVKFAPTGADEQSSIIIENEKEQMASVTLSLHAKQPKRATICYDNAYIEKEVPVWEWHFGKGFDIVQTDWMALWYGFRKKYFKK